MVPTHKRCTECGEDKPIDRYQRHAARRDGRQSRCAVCQTAKVLAYEATPRGRENKRAKGLRRRARVRGATPELFAMAELYALWAEADAWACTFCGAPWEHIEHFVPLARGGAHALGNLWPACADCNLAKSDRDPWEFLRSRGVPHA